MSDIVTSHQTGACTSTWIIPIQKGRVHGEFPLKSCDLVIYSESVILVAMEIN